MVNDNFKKTEADLLNDLFNAKKEREKVKGVTFNQKTVATLAGWTQPNVSSYLRGIVELKEDSATFFSNVLDVPISAFSPRLAEKIKHRELIANNPSLNKVKISYVPKYNFVTLSEIRHHLKDVNFIMPASKETTPIAKELPHTAFSIDLPDNSLDSKFSKGTTFIFDPMLEPKPTNIVLAAHKDKMNEFLFRSYKVTEILEDGTEVFELEALNPAYPTIKSGYEVIAVAVSAQKNLL